MTLRRAMSAITAIIAIIVVMCTTVLAATVQPTVAEVEVTYNNSEASKVATKKYPKSMQKQLLESKDNKEVARALEVAKSLKANTVKVEKVAKVRVKAGSIDFQWTPIFVGYTWIADLSMWSNKGLLGKEATLYFLDKNATVLWSTTIIFPKELKVPEVNTGKEEIVPPCPNDMAPTSAPVEGVEIGVATGRK